MKTASLTYPSSALSFIDTAPLAARYEVLCASMMMFIAAGQMARVLRLSHKAVRLVRAFTYLDTHNILLRRKLDMLCNATWRERVLRELGGLRKLKLWEAAQKRIEARQDSLSQPLPISKQIPAWLLTPERIAESERLKAHARLCGRATAHPRVVRDRVKMDFDGMFRLAPLPRLERAKRQLIIYTQNTIVDYDWNNVPFAIETGLGPAMVWPAEFYAAIGLERETEDDGEEQHLTLSSSTRAQPAARGPRKDSCPQRGPRIHGDDKREAKSLPLIPAQAEALQPKDVLSPKVTYDLLDSPLS